MAFGPAAPGPQQRQGGNGGGAPDAPGFDAARPYDPANPPAVGEWVRLSSGAESDTGPVPEEAGLAADEVPTAPRITVPMTVPILLPLGTPPRAAAPPPDEPVTLVGIGGMREALAAAEERAVVAPAAGPSDRVSAHQEFSPPPARRVNPGAVAGITALIVAVLVAGGWALYAGRPSSAIGPDGAASGGMSVPADPPPALTPPPLAPSPSAVVTPAHEAAPSALTIPSAGAAPPSPAALPATGTPAPTPARTPLPGPAARTRPTPPPAAVRGTAARGAAPPATRPRPVTPSLTVPAGRPLQGRPPLSPAATAPTPRRPEQAEPVTSPTPEAIPPPTEQEPPVAPLPPSPAPPAAGPGNGALR